MLLYSTATKLRVIDYTLPRCPDGGVVETPGAADAFYDRDITLEPNYF